MTTYRVGGRTYAPGTAPQDEGLQIVGTPLRDAAVDPRPEDFPGVPNAGTADPHGAAVRCLEVTSAGYAAAVGELRQLEADGVAWADRGELEQP